MRAALAVVLGALAVSLLIPAVPVLVAFLATPMSALGLP